VFVPVAYFVQCPEKIIPSWVRLEPAKERLDLWGEILGPSESVCHLSDTASEGEGRELGFLNSASNSDGIPCIVQDATEVMDEISDDIGKGIWNGFSQLDLVNLMVRSTRIRLDKSLVWIDSRELCDFPLKISKVFLSPRNLEAVVY